MVIIRHNGAKVTEVADLQAAITYFLEHHGGVDQGLALGWSATDEETGDRLETYAEWKSKRQSPWRWEVG